jgi:hypothetical protein
MMYNAYKIKKAKIQQQAENIYREMNNIWKKCCKYLRKKCES